MDKFGISELVQVWEDLGNNGYPDLRKVRLPPHSCRDAMMDMRIYLPTLEDWKKYFIQLAETGWADKKGVAINTAIKLETLEKLLNGAYGDRDKPGEEMFWKS